MIDYKITELTFSFKEENVDEVTSSKVVAQLYAHITYQTQYETGEVFAPVQTIAEKTFDSEGYVINLKTYEPKYATKEELLAKVEELVERRIESNLKKISYDSYVKRFLSDEKLRMSVYGRDSSSMTDMLNTLNY